MCLASKKVLADTNPETFADEEIGKAVAELKDRANGGAEPADSTLAKLLRRLGCEPERHGTLADAVLVGVREGSEFLAWKKTTWVLAGPALTGRTGTPAGRRAYVEECKAKIGKARGEP